MIFKSEQVVELDTPKPRKVAGSVRAGIGLGKPDF